jgi:geranylgeranyl diphosphate synthase type I
MGALLAGDASPALLAALSEYGLPLGEAFQFRDDLLGVFGDPSVTGKPAGDDLREGKRTALIAMADAKSTDSMKAESRQYFGKNDLDEKGVAILQEMIVSTGAKAQLETIIEELTSKALKAIENPVIDNAGRDLLNELALIATKRSM